MLRFVVCADGIGGAEAFRHSAFACGIQIIVSITFFNDQRDFTSEVNELERSDARVIVLFAQAGDVGLFMRTAFEAGVGGPGFLWFGGNAPTNSDTWLSDVGGMKDNPTLRLDVMKGYLGMTPSRGVGSAAYLQYLARLSALGGRGGANSTDCNLETDHDGNYIWAQVR